jgi:integrase/recombinase XerD
MFDPSRVRVSGPLERYAPGFLAELVGVCTLLNWYRAGVDVQPRLPLLSTYLGHVHPKDTYWYLQAAPELLQFAADRLQRSQGGAS